MGVCNKANKKYSRYRQLVPPADMPGEMAEKKRDLNILGKLKSWCIMTYLANIIILNRVTIPNGSKVIIYTRFS